MIRSLPALCTALLLSLAANAQDRQKATLRIVLPAPGAQLVIQGQPLKVTDKDVRVFESPPLESGKTFVYDVKATWTENGKTMTRERSIKVMAGLTSELDLRKVEDDSPNIVKPPEKPADRPNDKPVIRPDKPLDKPADKPLDKPADKPADKPLDKPADKPADKPPDPYIATPPEVVEYMLNLAKVRDTDVVYDIGCGDGRIALAALNKFKAKKAVGIDSHTDRLAEAQKLAATLGDRLEFRKRDIATLSERDLADATVITLDNSALKYLLELSPVLKKLKPGTRIIAHELEIPGLKADDRREQTVAGLDHAIYLYTAR